MVQAINRTGVNWSTYGHIIEDIRSVLDGFNDWQTCHIKRRANSAAHLLAQLGPLQASPCLWIDFIDPKLCFEVVVLEFHL